MSCRLDTRYCILMFDVFDKLVHGQVIFGCSFHFVTRCHALSWRDNFVLFSHVCHCCWCFISNGKSFSLLVTLGHALSRVATILYCVLSAKSYFVALLRFRALSRVVTHSHALSCFALNGHFWPFSHVCHSSWCFMSKGHTFWRLVTLLDLCVDWAMLG
jgi:hypothetical protein